MEFLGIVLIIQSGPQNTDVLDPPILNIPVHSDPLDRPAAFY